MTAKTRTLANGVVQDVESGKFIRGAKLKPDHARTLQALSVESRHEKGIQAAQQALAAGRPESEIAGRVYGGWQSVVAARLRVALNDEGHAGNQAAEFVGRAAGILDKQERLRLKQGDQEIEGTPDVIRSMLASLRSGQESEPPTTPAEGASEHRPQDTGAQEAGD